MGGGGGVVDVDVSDWIFYCISISEMLVTHISSAVYFEQCWAELGPIIYLLSIIHHLV